MSTIIKPFEAVKLGARFNLKPIEITRLYQIAYYDKQNNTNTMKQYYKNVLKMSRNPGTMQDYYRTRAVFIKATFPIHKEEFEKYDNLTYTKPNPRDIVQKDEGYDLFYDN